jgi:23S rRNA pseudouridine1911/1915/1917 synthase
VPETFEGVPGRLDAVVAHRLQIPRAEAQRAIEQRGVQVDGTPRDKSFRLSGGERIEVDLAPARALPPEGPPVDVRFADEHLLVVAKPAGLPTHPTENRRTGTLVNRLLAMGVPLSAQAGPLRPGIVHRLDAGTSGLMLVACDEHAHTALSAMFRRHEVDRRYLALVRGAVGNDRFIIDAALGRRGARVRVQAVAGRAAATAIEARERFADATLVEAAPRTGRTHQIRVHLAAVGHPILGDGRYGGGGDDAKRLGLARPFLHSWRIGFDHPVTGERIELEEPLPPDLEHALARLRDPDSA